MDSEQHFQIEQMNLLKYLEEYYDFDGLIHATPFANFLNIMDDGYVTGRKNNSHIISDIANQEVINKTNNYVKKCARFYFYKNTPTYYHFNESHPNDLIYLVFDWAIFSFNSAIIYDGNPAVPRTRCMSTRDYLLYNRDLIDWENVLSRAPFKLDEDCSDEEFEEKRECIRKRNAELDIDGNVSLDYLNKIILKDENQVNVFYDFLDSNGIKPNIIKMISAKVIIDSSYF